MPAGVLPWGGIYDGRERIADFFKALGESLETFQFELRDVIAQGKKVVVVGYQRGRAKPTGRLYEIEFVYIYGLYVMGKFQNSG
jgi:ketosteroid isomerase-like protein